MQEITIKIYKSSVEEGFFYDIFEGDVVDEFADPLDGGVHTGENIMDAIDSACDMAKDLIAKADNRKN